MKKGKDDKKPPTLVGFNMNNERCILLKRFFNISERILIQPVGWSMNAMRENPRKRLSFLLSSFFLVVLVFLSACGGGGGASGGGSPTVFSVTGLYTGGTSLSYYHLPGIVDAAFASGYSPTAFTLTLNSSNQFFIVDNLGNQGGGTYKISGNSLVISSGSFYLSNACTSSSSSSCVYTIESGSGGLSVGADSISGTLDFYSSSNSTTPAFSTTLGLTVNTLKSVSLTSLENQVFTNTFGTINNPNPNGTPPYNCLSANTVVGTTGLTVNGSTVYFPCITWNTYVDGNDGPNPNPPPQCPAPSSSGPFYPCNGTAYETVMCPTLAQTCYPSTSYIETNFPFIPKSKINYPALNVPSNALAFYVIATNCPSGSCSGAAADAGGYIVPASGAQGGVLGKLVYVSNYCSQTTTNTGTVSVLVSTKGSLQGSYFYGSAMPSSSTFCGYPAYPAGFVSFTSKQF